MDSVSEVPELGSGQQANEALSKETLQCPDLVAMDAQCERATLGNPAPDGTFHRRAGAKACTVRRGRTQGGHRPSDPIPW